MALCSGISTADLRKVSFVQIVIKITKQNNNNDNKKTTTTQQQTFRAQNFGEEQMF